MKRDGLHAETIREIRDENADGRARGNAPRHDPHAARCRLTVRNVAVLLRAPGFDRLSCANLLTFGWPFFLLLGSRGTTIAWLSRQHLFGGRHGSSK
jgi:hypothetical protein